MRLTVAFLGIAAILFLLSTVPRIQRPWMIGVGLALLAASFMPWFNRSIE